MQACGQATFNVTKPDVGRQNYGYNTPIISRHSFVSSSRANSALCPCGVPHRLCRVLARAKKNRIDGLTEVRMTLRFSCSRSFLVIVPKQRVQKVHCFIGDISLILGRDETRP
jgi:hypothetical protein